MRKHSTSALFDDVDFSLEPTSLLSALSASMAEEEGSESTSAGQPGTVVEPMEVVENPASVSSEGECTLIGC
jgi:hypothetical protein